MKHVACLNGKALCGAVGLTVRYATWRYLEREETCPKCGAILRKRRSWLRQCRLGFLENTI